MRILSFGNFYENWNSNWRWDWELIIKWNENWQIDRRNLVVKINLLWRQMDILIFGIWHLKPRLENFWVEVFASKENEKFINKILQLWGIFITDVKHSTTLRSQTSFKQTRTHMMVKSFHPLKILIYSEASSRLSRMILKFSPCCCLTFDNFLTQSTNENLVRVSLHEQKFCSTSPRTEREL